MVNNSSNSTNKGSLNLYYVDATNLSPEEREKLYSQLEQRCFLVSKDLNAPGYYEVFLAKVYELEKIIDFPASCVITRG